MPKILSIFAMLVTLSACSLDDTFKSGLEYFSHNIFDELVKAHGHENIIFSPFSAQTSLAMVRMGADGETAVEMDRAMGFSNKSMETMADNYFTLLSHYENSDLVHLANKVYLMTDYELQDSYNAILSEKFYSTAETIDFSQNKKAASVINHWVESKTNHLIKDVITPDILNSDTRLVLLNAIHFKGEWVKPFDPKRTTVADFYIEEHKSVPVQMMNIVDNFAFGDCDDWDFAAVRLPYKDSDLSMLIFSPYERTGLSDILEKLKDISLETITKKLKHQTVEVIMPKFKIELQIELTDILKKLNMNRMFENANFSKMLKSSERLEISHVIHKASIEVTEMGTVASAAAATIGQSRMMPPAFLADRPFHYIVMNTENVVLFQGNVVNL